MHGFITCVLLALLAAGPARGLSLYKCVLLDGSGVVYQDLEPNSSECRIEKKEIDPDANVIPFPESTLRTTVPARFDELISRHIRNPG